MLSTNFTKGLPQVTTPHCFPCVTLRTPPLAQFGSNLLLHTRTKRLEPVPAKNRNAKYSHSKNSGSTPKKYEGRKMKGTTMRLLPTIARLKTGIAKNNISHVNEDTLIRFAFLQGSQIYA